MSLAGHVSDLDVVEALRGGDSRFDPTDTPISSVHITADPRVTFDKAEQLEVAYAETGVPDAQSSEATQRLVGSEEVQVVVGILGDSCRPRAVKNASDLSLPYSVHRTNTPTNSENTALKT